MSELAPIILVLILVGGIITWGAITDWTFSGLVPREGAKCTPGEDEKDENAKLYVYDEDEECTFIKRCKTGWEPNTSNTACEFIQSGEICTANTLYIANVDTYKFSQSGACNLAKTCKTGWNPSTDAKTCIVDEWTLPTKSKLSKYQALGFPVDASKKEAKFSDLDAITIEGCRTEAKNKGAQMIGFRSLGNELKEKSCWMYDDPGMDTTKYSMPTTPQAMYWVECTDKSNNAATSLCTKS